MRSLILFRHAKSDWDAPFSKDHDRPLAKRGVRVAKSMGEMLAGLDQVPDLAITSTAKRARDTLKLALREGNWDCPTMETADLYDTTPDKVIAFVQALEQDPKTLMLVGHETTWSDLASRLIGRGSNIRVPTGTVLKINFEFDAWSDLGPAQGELRWLLPPKLFM